MKVLSQPNPKLGFVPVFELRLVGAEEVNALTWDSNFTVIFRRISVVDPIKLLPLVSPDGDNRHQYFRILRKFDHEFEIQFPDSDHLEDEYKKSAMEIVATQILLLVSLRSGAVGYCPVLANHSFCDISKISNFDLKLHSLQALEPRLTSKNNDVTIEDFNWACQHFDSLHKLRTQKRFKTAWMAYSSAILQTHTELSIIVSWSGIEALLGVNSELTFRTALLLAKFLSPERSKQMITFRAAKRSYSIRSKIAHGADLGDEGIEIAAHEVHIWLRQCLESCIDQGNLPDEEELLFG